MDRLRVIGIIVRETEEHKIVVFYYLAKILKFKGMSVNNIFKAGQLIAFECVNVELHFLKH